MKKKLLLLSMLIYFNSSYSQIEFIEREKPIIKAKPYDSSSIKIGQNMEDYLGYDLLYVESSYFLKPIGNNTSPLLYESFSEQKQDTLLGKIFTVINIVNNKYSKYFVLNEKQSNIKYRFDQEKIVDNDYYSNFIPIAYIEKLKRKIVGKRYYFIKTGIDGVVEKIMVEKPSYKLVAIVRDNKGRLYNTCVECLIGNEMFGKTIDMDKEKIYISLFGKYFDNIKKGEVVLGMSPEMCIMSLGIPYDKTTIKSASGDVIKYEYENGYYKKTYIFTNKKLTQILSN